MKLNRPFRYAWAGLKYCFASQLNFRLHLLFAVAAIGCGFALQVSNLEWLVIAGCIATVLSLEMLNTAIEKLCDLVHPGPHPQVKIIKDVAAAAVLVAATGSAVAGLIIFVPKACQLIFN